MGGAGRAELCCGRGQCQWCSPATIEAVTERLRDNGEAELVAIVTTMLDEHPWRRT
jgi:hypothetical protein